MQIYESQEPGGGGENADLRIPGARGMRRECRFRVSRAHKEVEIMQI